MSKRATVIPLIVLVVAALLFFVINGRWTSWSGGRAEQKTDDAYVQADMTPLSTRISGTVRKMKVQDFDSVKASQVLVEIDDDDYRAIVEEAKAALAASQATLEDNQAAKRIQEAKIQSAEAMVAEAEAAVSTAQAGVASTQPDVEQAAIERKRQEALLASKATTRQQPGIRDSESGELLWTAGQPSGRPGPGAGRAGEQPGADRGPEAGTRRTRQPGRSLQGGH